MKSYRTPSDNYDVVTKGYVDNYITNIMNNLKLCKITQSEYDSLESPDENTLYLIIDYDENTTTSTTTNSSTLVTSGSDATAAGAYETVTEE